MRRYLLLLALSLLSVLGIACEGEVPDDSYFPAANFLALNLSATDVVLDPGTTYVAGATGIPVGLGSGVDLTQFVEWSSNNPSVASVSANGIVSANGPGFASITARLAGDGGSFLSSGTMVVRVTGTPAAGPSAVELVGLVIRQGDGTPISGVLRIADNEDLEFSVSGRFSDGTTRSVGGVTWRVSDPTVATVAADGTLTPLKAGVISVNARLGAIESNYVVVQITKAP